MIAEPASPGSTAPGRTGSVAIVSDYFLDYVGGAQTSMREQKLALERAGHRVVRVSPVHGPGRRVRRSADGILIRPFFTLPGVRLAVIPNSEKTRRTLRLFFERERVEVVHVQTEFGLAHAAADVAAELGIPVVHTVHTFYWASDDNWNAPLEPFIRWALNKALATTLPRQSITPRPVDNLLRNMVLQFALRADAVISPSAHQARDLEAAGVRAPIAIVPNPITTSPRPPLPLPVGEPPRLLWVARCEGVKRPLIFAAAAVLALARTGNGFSVDFVGDGSQRAALQRLVLGHPQLRVQGSLPHDAVLDLMDAASVVVLSSVGFDNQPMTIAEAVSRERAILYCDPKLREGLLHAGYLADNPDVSGLADAIVDLVERPEKLRELSAGAALDGEQFSGERYVEGALAAFELARSRLRE
ncbi:glycosyltransferase family 4 protein [Marisediminicola senii]|uniref:glycosyltransferase family 4 protein n=1 Tax=Marisediminicola senii TaxID=2711233 RepID=UPI0013EE3757|nr:glycosyltransferase family 4 protein [Marisediminicola senii]